MDIIKIIIAQTIPSIHYWLKNTTKMK